MSKPHRFEVRLPQELFDAIATVAEANRRSINNELVQAAETWIRLTRDPAFQSALAAMRDTQRQLNEPTFQHALAELRQASAVAASFQGTDPEQASGSRAAQREVVTAKDQLRGLASLGPAINTVAPLLELLQQPDVQEAIRALSQPDVRETLRRVQALGVAWPQISATAFARDWDSAEDRVYDALE